jgi:hypothetical protein
MYGYTETESCPICKSRRLSRDTSYFTAPFFSASIESLNFMVATVTTYVKCDKCGVLIQNPRMNDDGLARYYSDGIYTRSIGIDESRLNENELARADSLMEFLERYNINPKSHMDIGASRGHFLQLTHALYKCKSYGTDLYGKYKNEPMHHADLLTSIHVLEHCSNPREELKRYKRYCNKYLIVEVPVVNKLAFRFAHLYAFPENVIKEIIGSAGFRIIASEQAPDTRILAEVV